MAHAAKRRTVSHRGTLRPPRSVEGTALISLQTMHDGDVARITKALRIAGISELRPTKIILSQKDARELAAGHSTKIAATLVAGTADEADGDAAPQAQLARTIDAARARGDAAKQALLADAEMLSTAEMASRLGMSEEGVRLKRKRHELIGLELAKRGIRYPAWQIVDAQRLLPKLPALFNILGDNPWTIYRFLLQHHAELGGSRALDALRRGSASAVIAAAQGIAAGDFS